jgi:hypothetical protein
MNYDTVLPPRIRTELLNKPKRLKLWHKIAIGLVLLIGLRHLNTVPHREWESAVVTYELNDPTQPEVINTNGGPDFRPRHAVSHGKKVYTAEGIFGSSYRASYDGDDLGYSSKKFGDVFLKTFGPTDQNLKILRAIDP